MLDNVSHQLEHVRTPQSCCLAEKSARERLLRQHAYRSRERRCGIKLDVRNREILAFDEGGTGSWSRSRLRRAIYCQGDRGHRATIGIGAVEKDGIGAQLVGV